jgi:hypothetical protein
LAELVIDEQEQEIADMLAEDSAEDIFDDEDIPDDDGMSDEQDALDDEDISDDEAFTVVDRSAPVVPKPGCAVSFYLDNKRHHAVCLAIINDELLLEHKGASRCFLFTGKVLEIVQRLRFGIASATIVAGSLKTCSYRSVPKKWLKEMVKTGQTWKGIERGGGLAPLPAELFKDDGQLDLF